MLDKPTNYFAGFVTGNMEKVYTVGNMLEVNTNLALNNKQLQGWTFYHSLVINGKEGKDAIVVTNKKHFVTVGGVYAVYHKDQLLYIGSFSHTFQNRWINKQTNKNCVRVFRHFKGDFLAEQARNTKEDVHVYVLPLYNIKQQYVDNRWVNQMGVESELIKHYEPPLNNHHNQRKGLK